MVIDPEIPAQIPARELGEVQPIMQDWPQHPIGKTAVVFFKTFLRKVSNYIFDIFRPDCPGLQLMPGCDLAAPSQPDAAVVLERRPQCNFKPPGALGVVARNRNAVRNDD